MQTYCGNCFQESLDVHGICVHCGFDNNKNKEKSPHALPPGSILNGRYIIGRVLGQGGFGITYLAWDTLLDKCVAVKEFYPNGTVFRRNKVSTAVECGA